MYVRGTFVVMRSTDSVTLPSSINSFPFYCFGPLFLLCCFWTTGYRQSNQLVTIVENSQAIKPSRGELKKKTPTKTKRLNTELEIIYILLGEQMFTEFQNSLTFYY